LRAAAGDGFRIMAVPANIESLCGLDASAYIVAPAEFERWSNDTPVRLTTAIDVHRLAVYVEMTPRQLHRLAELVRAGIRHLLIADLEDTFVSIRRLLDELTSSALGVELVRRLSPQVATLPEGLRRALYDVVLRPEQYSTTGAVCSAVGIPRRSCDRLLADAGLSSVRRIMQAARVLRAIPLIREKRLKLQVIAERLGLGSHRRIASDLHAVLGASIREAMMLTDATILRRAEAHAQQDPSVPRRQLRVG
jgi:AraC-like DNA-binding protein